ncbi:MAG: hypothetical protein IPK75_10515 [Acidobacteria bacterium]|nr:hypothetical protein [Acidobacteriota bacterium]
MKFVSLALALAALSLSAACQTAPADSEGPAEPAETAPAQEAPVLPVKPKVGGPCAYEYSVIDAVVVAVAENDVRLQEGTERAFSLSRAQFPSAPEVGETYKVTKQQITKGTCVPVMYRLVSPPADN